MAGPDPVRARRSAGPGGADPAGLRPDPVAAAGRGHLRGQRPPTFVGGLVLSPLADRLPRRAVMIACDLARMVLVLIMAIPGVPLPVLVGLLFTVTIVSTPFTSARSGMYPDILPGDLFALGTAVTMTTYQVALVAGFAGGGAAVGFFGVRP